MKNVTVPWEETAFPVSSYFCLLIQPISCKRKLGGFGMGQHSSSNNVSLQENLKY
jgi:hypothetical protein